MKESSNLDKTKIKIGFALFQLGNPTNKNQIAKEAKISAQLVSHHLPAMINEGYVLKIIDDEENAFYMLQPFFYDDNLINELIQNLIPLVDFINENEFIDEYIKTERQEAIVNCIRLLLHFIGIEIGAIK